MANEDTSVTPQLELIYPAEYGSRIFPIIVVVDETDITTTGEFCTYKISMDKCIFIWLPMLFSNVKSLNVTTFQKPDFSYMNFCQTLKTYNSLSNTYMDSLMYM